MRKISVLPRPTVLIKGVLADDRRIFVRQSCILYFLLTPVKYTVIHKIAQILHTVQFLRTIEQNRLYARKIERNRLVLNAPLLDSSFFSAGAGGKRQT